MVCFSKGSIFSVPAFLLEKISDPTGAGDSFAGGFIGYLTRSPKLAAAVVKRAAVYGSVMASYNVESFSLSRLAGLRKNEIEDRVRHFRELTRF